MPKSLPHFSLRRFLTLAAGLLAVLAATSLYGRQMTPADETPSPRIWADGGEAGVYFIYARSNHPNHDFQISFRSTSRDKFKTSSWRQGEPQVIAAGKYRLMVFFTNGACRSYDLVSLPRHERRLPDNLTAVDCVMQQEKLYVLARAQNPTTIPLTTESTPGGAPSPSEDKLLHPPQKIDADRKKTQRDAAEQTNQNNKIPAQPPPPAALSVAAGEYVFLTREKTDPWQLLIRQPLALKQGEKPQFAIQGDEIHLFNIEKAQADRTGRQGSLWHSRWTGQNWTPAQILPVDNVVDYDVLEVNHQIRLVAFVRADETTLPNAPPGLSDLARFRLGWPVQQGWNFTAPLENAPAEILTASPDKIAFAEMGQNLAAFELREAPQVDFSIYSSTGQAIQTAVPAITASQDDESILLISLVAMLTLVISLALLFWRRTDAFIDTGPLPDYVRLAPLSRRLLAFCLDLLPALIITFTLFPEEFPEPPAQLSLWEQIQLTWNDPLLLKLKIQLTFSALAAGYMMISELLLSATPGKLALRLLVLDRHGAALSKKQALLRNLLRLVELQFAIIAVLVLITKRRQRLGDLAARTIVVLQNPDLQKHLWQSQNLSKPADEAADHHGKSPDEAPDPPQPPDDENY